MSVATVSRKSLAARDLYLTRHSRVGSAARERARRGVREGWMP